VGGVDGRSEIRVDLLGPLRLVVDGSPVEVRGPKRRALLALLALAEGRTVTVDHLLDALWPAELPESGRQALHTHVSRLRLQLGSAAGRLTTPQDGYRLALGVDELDLTRARALLRAARVEIENDPTGACSRLREAHGLWRGPVLADLTDVGPIATAMQECERLRGEVTRVLVSAAVATGQAEAVVGLAAELVTAEPLSEPAVLLLMRALAAAGRAPEALRVGREYRRALADETGLDPSPALDGLERDVAGGSAGPTPPRREAFVRPTTRLVGRDADVARLRGMLGAERLVTIVGPGGVGKTRVALEVAGRAETAAVLMLAPVTEQAAIAHVLAAALNLNVTHGDVLAACVALLGDRTSLLVIDNCEHLLDAVRDTVDELLSGCPRLSVLATSREPLGLVEEHVLRLAPLRLPEAGEQRLDVASVAVFLDRAARVRPGWRPMPDELRTVADIVRRLDGMPLAIELAAGRLSTFSLTELRDRLDRSLDLLTGGRTSGDARHRTLRATVEWSYRLLGDDEQRLFRHLAVFVDGADLDTAETVATDLGLSAEPGTVLARLVDASMVDAVFAVGSGGGTRYRTLETLRAFGLDRLADTGEEDAAQERLVRWAVERTAWIGSTVITEREPDADALLRRELPNLRAAWRTARRRGSVDGAAAIVSALFEAFAWRDLVEIRDWAAELADDPALAGHPRAAAVLGTAAYGAYLAGDHPRADRLARTGLEQAPYSSDAWYCWHALSVAALARGDFDEAVEHALAAAANAPGSRGHLELAALGTLYLGSADEARSLTEQGAAEAKSPTWLAFSAYVRGEIASYTGDAAAAEGHYVRAIELARSAGTTFYVGVATVGLLAVRAAGGRVDEALDGYRDVIDYFVSNGNWTHLWATLRNLADLLRQLGDHEPAAVIDAAADQAPDAPGTDRPPPPAVPVPGRAAVLALARQAIERHLTR
jgi:predicted ATPase/DNA-binding SARP family transcriptional activator